MSGWRGEGWSTPAGGGGSSYVGPAEVSGWTTNLYGYWGLRAYHSSYATGSNPCIDIADASLANPATINIAANGYVDTVALSAWVALHGSTILVTKVYQQIATGGVGATNHLIVTGSAPHLVLSAIGGLPMFEFDGTSRWFVTSSTVSAQAIPITATWIGQNTANGGEFVTEGNFDCQFGVPTTGDGDIAQDNGVTVHYTGNVFSVNHSYISVINDAASSMKIDTGAVQTAGSSPGTGGFAGGAVIAVGSGTPTGSALLTGEMFEVFMVTAAPNSTQQGALTTNQHAIGTGF